MIPLNSIVISKDNVGFNIKTALFCELDVFMPIIHETDEIIDIETIRQQLPKSYDLDDNALTSVVEEYKKYQPIRLNADLYMSLFKEYYETIKVVMDSLNIQDKIMRAYIEQYIASKYYNL